jgi:23S rRNA pseudouridine1911/1915/1917 synthase
VSENHGYVYRDRVRPADAGTSVLDYHVARFGHSDVELWRRSIESGAVRVNGRGTSAEARLAAGDELEFHRPPWREPDAPLSFEVLLEDEHVLAVCKPSGLQVIPAGAFLEHTLWSLVRKSAAGREPCSPVHRLGRGTSGITLFGKTGAARASLSAQFRSCTPCKTYLAIVSGAALATSCIARQPIGSVPHGPMRLHVARADGKPSATRLRVLARGPSAAGGGTRRALVAAQPITGRPDQIRIHLAACGAPLAGDPLFGAGGIAISDARPGEGGYLLHATALSFEHPSSGARIKLRSRPQWLERETSDMQGACTRISS